MKRILFIAFLLLVLITIPNPTFAEYTADLCTGGTASASSVFMGNIAAHAFDNDFGPGSGAGNGTQWSSNNGSFPEWIRYDFGSGKTIKQLRFYTCYDDLYKPFTWQFQGSNNGSAWTNIHTVSSTVLSLHTWYTYNTSDFTNNTAYRYYQILITASHTGNSYVDVEEIEMMEEIVVVTTPTVTTTTATSITTTEASSGGNVTADGGASVTARGVCWGASINPTTAGNHTTDGTGIGVFVSAITGLSPGTEYHYRAYATNSEGTSYGSDQTFTTGVTTSTIPAIMILLE